MACLRVRAMLRWLGMIEDFLFPEPLYCPLCGEQPLDFLECCGKCLAQLGIDWKLRPVGSRLTGSLFVYRDYGREVVQQLKFHGGYRTAVAVGALLGRALRETPEFAEVELLVPVPLHPARERRRGFNQAEALAHGIRSQWPRPLFHGLVRVRDTPAQSGLSLEERRSNVRRAFAVVTDVALAGKRCLVVDDVMTSGSTFEGVAGVLESLGAVCLGVSAARAVLEKNPSQC